MAQLLAAANNLPKKNTPPHNKRLFQERRRRINKRLGKPPGPERPVPMMTAANIQYELADRVQGLSAGGIGVMLLLARNIGLISDIDAKLQLLKIHLPYHESDHVLNIAFNILAGGQRIEHLELRRNDEVYLNALGADRIPDPTTAGDFCRRFRESDVITLMEAINQARRRVWVQQPDEFFAEAILDADGTIVPSDSECNQGMDFAYNGRARSQNESNKRSSGSEGTRRFTYLRKWLRSSKIGRSPARKIIG